MSADQVTNRLETKFNAPSYTIVCHKIGLTFDKNTAVVPTTAAAATAFLENFGLISLLLKTLIARRDVVVKRHHCAYSRDRCANGSSTKTSVGLSRVFARARTAHQTGAGHSSLCTAVSAFSAFVFYLFEWRLGNGYL